MRTAAAVVLACVAAAAVPAGTRSQGTADARFDALASLTEAKMKEYGVPGVALGIVDDGVVTIRGLGVTNVEDPLPVTAHTVFPIASISKTFAATAMMRLVEQGKVDLARAGADVPARLPRARRGREPRRDGLAPADAHAAAGKGRCPVPSAATTRSRTSSTTITDLMQVAPPGAAWSYNNAGFSIAGPRHRSRSPGTSINRAMRDLVFQPLGLEHAGTTAGDFIVNRFAAGHATARRHADAAAAVLAVGRASRPAASGCA